MIEEEVLSEESISPLKAIGSIMQKRYYKIRQIPDDKIGEGVFEAPLGWDLYCVWTTPTGITYGIFEKVEDV